MDIIVFGNCQIGIGKLNSFYFFLFFFWLHIFTKDETCCMARYRNLKNHIQKKHFQSTENINTWWKNCFQKKRQPFFDRFFGILILFFRKLFFFFVVVFASGTVYKTQQQHTTACQKKKYKQKKLKKEKNKTKKVSFQLKRWNKSESDKKQHTPTHTCTHAHTYTQAYKYHTQT